MPELQVDVCFLCSLPGFPTVPQYLNPDSGYRFLCIGFQQLNTVAACSNIIDEAESLQGGASPLWPTRFSVYASPLLFAFATVSIPSATLSARGATLDTGGWLALMDNLP